MAMINCPECGHAMSSTAAACPNCGHVMTAAHAPGTAAHAAHTTHHRKRVGAGRWLAGLFFLILLVLGALWYFDVVNFT
ncbi:MAG TPA: zinc ribbon domain-containing protein [Longimicrobiales bacterium]